MTCRKCSLSLLFSAYMLVLTHLVAANELTIPAEHLPGRKAQLGANGMKGAIIEGDGLTIPLELPFGRIRVEATIGSNRKGSTLRQRPVILDLGGARATQTVEGLDNARQLAVELLNGKTQVDLSVRLGTPTVEMQQELAVLEAQHAPRRAPDINSLETDAEADHELGNELLSEIVQGKFPDVSGRVTPVVLLHKIRIIPLSCPVVVTNLSSDRITYQPDGTGNLRVELENVTQAPGEAEVTVAMTAGLMRRTELLTEKVKLPAGAALQRTIPFNVGPARWGRGFEVLVKTADGTDLATHAVSVIDNPWMVAMHGAGTPMHGSERWDAKQARLEAERLARANMDDYSNLYEAFAWAPCDYSDLTPDDNEPFFSGQTQYCKKQSSLKILHDVFHEHGLSAITYGKACASGLPGLEYSHRYPERMNVFGHSGFAHEHIDVDVIDRMLEGRYRRHGRDEDFWQMWISCWTHYGNHATTDYGCDEIADSAKQLGWDGVRYDGAWMVWNDPAATARLLAYSENRIRSQVPGFAFGYNHCGPRHNQRAGAFTDIEMAAMARGGGLVMSEYYRNLTGPAKLKIAHLQDVGDFVRLHGGYFLCIYDDNTPWNAALVMASGARPMGGGGFKKFATRFSQYILDPALRRLEAPERVVRPVTNPGFRWDAFVYERVAAPGHRQLIMQLVNVSDETSFGGSYTTPAALNPPRRDLEFELTLPEGSQIRSVFACGDTQRFEPMPATATGTRLNVAAVDVWTMVVIDLALPETSPSLAELCHVPVVLKSPAANNDGQQEKADLSIGAVVGQIEQAAINRGQVAITPEVLEAVLAQGPPADTTPGERAFAPADFANHRGGRDAKWHEGNDEALAPVRNGNVDVLHARGVFSHRHRLMEALVELPNLELSDSCLRDGGGMGGLQADNAGCMEAWPSRPGLARQDVVVLDAVPMPALSLAQRRDLADFVRGGGGLLVMGSWYSLSKGEYEGSFVEEILPVLCVQTPYLRRMRPDSGRLEITPAYARVLGRSAPPIPAEFAVEWVNHVELKPGSDVLITTADGLPLLIAGPGGHGRTVIWTASASGTPAAPWWQSRWWPQVADDVLQHLAHEAETVDAQEAERRQARVADARAQLTDASLDALLEEELEMPTATAVPSAEPVRVLLQYGSTKDAVTATRYLLENSAKFDLAVNQELAELALPRLADSQEWAALARKYVGSPPIMLKTLVAELATALPDLDLAEIASWDVDEITRLRCLAALANPDALPELHRRNAELDAQEQRWRELEAAGESPHLCTDQYKTRLLRPYVTWAMIKCGEQSPETVYLFAKACLELPYYHWRQKWVLGNRYAALAEAQRQGRNSAEAKAAVRACQRAIADLAHAQQQFRSRFAPEILDTSAPRRQAVARALAEADCYKAVPMALAYLRNIEPKQLNDFDALQNAKLDGLRFYFDKTQWETIIFITLTQKGASSTHAHTTRS